MKVFPPSGPVEIVVIDILGPLTKRKAGIRFVIVMTDRCSWLMRALPMPRVTAPLVTTVLLEYWIVPCGIPNTIVTDNGPQIVSKFFAILYASLGAKLMTTTEYHPQCNGQLERFDNNLVARLRHYSNYYQTDWDMYV